MQKRNGVANGNGSAWDGGSLPLGFGDGNSAGAEPASFDKAENRVRIGGEDWGATLPQAYGMAEKKNVRCLRGFFELRGFVGENFAGGTIFDGRLKAPRASWAHRV